MIHQINIEGMDKVEQAIDHLRNFEPPEGYWLAFSGGKDSVVIKALADMAGVKYDAHYNITSVDPPELVRFIKDKYPDVAMDKPRDKDGKQITMWNLIPKKLMPPTRIVRYCCASLKEASGSGRLTVTGVRWAESANRKNNQGTVTIYKPNKALKDEIKNNQNFKPTNKQGVILVNDNTESREIIEGCYEKNKVVLNPIIDWTDAEVWEFIHEYNVPYCELYDQGYKRLGCIGCPMSTHSAEELEKYPKYKNLYLKAFEKMLEERNRRGKDTMWETAQEVMDWWLSK